MKKYKISNLDCPNCALKIENAVNQLETVRHCTINFAASSMTIDTENIEGVIHKMKSIEPGVEVSEYISPSREKPEQKKMPRALPSVLAAAVLFLAGIFLHDAGHLIMPAYACFAAAYIISGWKVLYNALRNIIRGRIFDENFLMSLATIGAIVIGDLEEATGVMLFFIIGELLQELSVNKTRKSIRSLLALKPDYANLKTPDGLKRTDPQEIAVGDILVVKPGERVPLDGIIISGSSQVDTSALSGESMPGYFKEQDTILAGMINKTHALEMEVTRPLSESSLSRILELVENAVNKKAKSERFITRFARYYTPVVVLGALGVALLTPLFFRDITFSQSVYRAFVLLVISCPCALVLSIPLSYFVGIGNAAKEGILIKGSNFLDLLTRVKTVIFDKTGTLTEGNFTVQNVVPTEGYSKEELLELAVKAESHSNHPIAASLREYYNKPLQPVTFSRYEEVGGRGIVAVFDNRTIVAGNDTFLHDQEIAHTSCFADGTVLHVAVNGVYTGYIVISDKIRENAAAAIHHLKRLGVRKTVMLTGDNTSAADHVARELQIDAWHANLLPADKITRLEELAAHQENRMIAFAGDGINDSPIIAQADIGIAMGKGSDAAIDVADIVLLSDNPDRIPEAIRIADKTKQVVKQNIIFAITVKLLFIILGAGGLAGMWWAVFADMGVSLIAVLNAIRIHR